MELLYEKKREESKSLFLNHTGSFRFPPHFHSNLELFAVRHGNYSVVCNGKSYAVTDGMIAFFDSYDIHSYGPDPTDSTRDGYVFLIPAQYAEQFLARRKGKQVACPVITAPTLCDELYELADRLLSKEESPQILSAACELLLAMLEQELTFVSAQYSDETALIKNILQYLNDNFRQDPTLPELAREFGYSEAHISRTFHRYFQTGIPRYVNELRLNYIDFQRRTNPKRKITDLIFDAGFKSIQTYYRALQTHQQLSSALN